MPVNRFDLALNKAPPDPVPAPLTDREQILKDYLPEATTRTFQVVNQFIVLVRGHSYSVVEVLEVVNQYAYPPGPSSVIVSTPSYFYRVPPGGSGHLPHAADVVPGIIEHGNVHDRLGSSYNDAIRRLQEIDREENPQNYPVEERLPSQETVEGDTLIPFNSSHIEPPTPCVLGGYFNPHHGVIKHQDYIWTHLGGWRIRGPVGLLDNRIPVKEWEQAHGKNSVIRSVRNSFWRRILSHIPRPYPF